MQTQPISFTIPGAQFEALRRRAGTLNLKPSEYAHRLFDAAYFVRCLAEKGEEPEDGALDRQVRDVFLLADCEPEFIAESLRLPEERVKRILDGWRQAARDLIDPPARPVPQSAGFSLTSGSAPGGRASDESPPSLPPPPGRGAGKRASPRPYTQEEVAVIGAMWTAGKPAKEIAAAIGRDAVAFSQWIQTHRHVCPKRKAG